MKEIIYNPPPMSAAMLKIQNDALGTGDTGAFIVSFVLVALVIVSVWYYKKNKGIPLYAVPVFEIGRDTIKITDRLALQNQTQNVHGRKSGRRGRA